VGKRRVKNTFDKVLDELVERDREVIFTGVMLALSKMGLYTSKEMVDGLDSYLCERAVKDLPYYISYLEEVVRLAKEKLERG